LYREHIYREHTHREHLKGVAPRHVEIILVYQVVREEGFDEPEVIPDI
jgi:hypothetical protein